MMTRAIAMMMALMLLSGCTSMNPTDFKDAEPRLVLEDYFAGETRAWGIFEDRFGTLRRQFTVDITGQWDGRELVLDERFHYADGERDRRVWRITKTGDHAYEGRAGDVVGTAEGMAYGNALNWRYDMDLKVGEGTWRVHFNDWMFLQPNGVLINRARVTKFGLEIGEVTLFFMKGAQAAALPDPAVSEPPVFPAARRAANQ
jgi:hypothetical protein